MILCQVDSDLQIRLLDRSEAHHLSRLEGFTGDVCNQFVCPPDTIDEFIDAARRDFADGKGFWAGIWKNHILAGVIGLHHDGRIGRIDYALSAPYRGQGIMTRSVQTLVDYAFAHLNLNRIQIESDVENFKSHALAARVGLRHRTVVKARYEHNGELRDTVLYSIEGREWFELPWARGRQTR